MTSHAFDASAEHAPHPVDISVSPSLTERNRLTTAFRPILAIPHVLLVGGPLCFGAGFMVWHSGPDPHPDWVAGGGAIGAVAAVSALIAWFAIVFGGQFPPGLMRLAEFYLRWRVRAAAYLMLLRDEYPPFGDEPYPAMITFGAIDRERNWVSVLFRIFLVVPHLIALVFLGVLWGFATLFAWFAILFTGEYPESLYEFSVGVLRWSVRVEAYLLLLHDQYPPFALH